MEFRRLKHGGSFLLLFYFLEVKKLNKNEFSLESSYISTHFLFHDVWDFHNDDSLPKIFCKVSTNSIINLDKVMLFMEQNSVNKKAF